MYLFYIMIIVKKIGNIEQIRTFHEQSFLTELRRSVALNPYHVAQCFLKYVSVQ